MEIRDWRTMLLPYEYAMEELKIKFRNIRRELIDRGEYSPIEFVTGRVKKINSIFDKCKRLNIPMDQFEEKIEDITGIRIMCQMVEDIYVVAQYIRDRSDMRVLYEKDYVKNPKKSGYRSYHMIIRYTIHTHNHKKDIMAEIQIRTLAMNFWATIEHSIKYKYDNFMPEDIQERLIASADAAFLLDREMSLIRQEIISAQSVFENKSITVDEITSLIVQLHEMGLSDQARHFQERLESIDNKHKGEELNRLKHNLIQTMLQERKRLYDIDLFPTIEPDSGEDDSDA